MCVHLYGDLQGAPADALQWQEFIGAEAKLGKTAMIAPQQPKLRDGFDSQSAVFGEVHRILRPGGHCVFYDIHPFQRPWKDLRTATEMEKSYFDTGPFARSEEGPHSFHWTMADLLNALAEAGLSLRRLRELPAADSRYWEGTGYAPGTQPGLLDWRTNPMAGLPVWLLVATCRAGHD